MKKLIFDSDLLIKKIQKKTGSVNKIVEQCLAGDWQPVISQNVLKECVDLLGKKDVEPEWQDVLEDYFAIAEIIKADYDIVEVKMNAASAKYIQCALASQADYLVTEDKNLLKLQKFFRTEIVTPKDFLRMVKKK